MFRTARIKLTAWYLVIIMLISIAFSVSVYHISTREVDRFAQSQRLRIERRLSGGQFLGPGTPRSPSSSPIQVSDPELIEEAKQRILFTLVIINGIILILSGGLGYILAGRTLAPIKVMVDEQNRFISDASHELRTPLTSLKSGFEVYLRNHHPTLPEARTLVSESAGEVDKLQSLSESLLQLAQYQKPNERMVFEKLALQDVIREAVRKIEPIAKLKGVTIAFDAQDITVKGNKYGLIDLMVILLDNAVKYTSKGDVITVSMEKTDKTAAVSVIDHGIGIPQNDLPHVFDRFYRADTARLKSSTGGYGLGLSIAQKIADTHKGNIQVKSKLRQGSTFVVRLPIYFS